MTVGFKHGKSSFKEDINHLLSKSRGDGESKNMCVNHIREVSN